MKEYKFVINGNKYEVFINNVEGKMIDLEVNGTPFSVEVDKEVRQPISAKAPKVARQESAPSASSDTSQKPSKSSSGGAVNAPLPGTVLDIFVKEGDKVTVGQKLVLLEAMKMENNIDSDKEGTVSSIKVHKGDSVMEGDVLLMIE